MNNNRPRIAPGGIRDIGLANWLICSVIARATGLEHVYLFQTLGRQRNLFRGWLHFTSQLMPFGALSRRDTERVILRVGHLRGCQYELDHHQRIGKRAGLDDAEQRRVFAGPEADGWTDRHRTLLSAVDMLVQKKDLDDSAWAALSRHYNERQLIEFVMLVGQYEMLATAITTLRIPRDV